MDGTQGDGGEEGDVRDGEALERILRRHRIAGPPHDLRARIVETAREPLRPAIRDWLPALAAAALIVLFSVLASGVRARLVAQMHEPPGVEQTLVPAQGDPINEP